MDGLTWECLSAAVGDWSQALAGASLGDGELDDDAQYDAHLAVVGAGGVADLGGPRRTIFVDLAIGQANPRDLRSALDALVSYRAWLMVLGLNGAVCASLAGKSVASGR